MRNARGVFRFVDARRFDLDAAKACVGEQIAVLHLLERAGDAADPQLHVAPNFRRGVAAHDDVGHRESAAGFEHAERLAQHAPLVGREIDDAVRDDDVDRVVGKRDVSRSRL